MIRVRDHDELHRTLRDSIDTLALELLGKPSARHSQELRFGSNGGISVVTRGSKRGIWFDHSAGEGGGPIKLIMRERGLDYHGALDWAKRWLGWPKIDCDDRRSDAPQQEQTYARRAEERAAQKAQIDSAEADEAAAKKASAQRLWEGATPIVPGDAADLYLTKTRAIPRPTHGWPADVIRSNRNGLIAIATCGDVPTGGQAIALTMGGVKRPDEGGIAKRSFGVIRGAVVRIPGAHLEPLLVCEGLETGLSLWSSTGYEIWVTLGILTLDKLSKLPLDRVIVLCRDDDGHNSKSFNSVRKVQRVLLSRGYDVRIATPWPQQRQDKSDFNDVIKSDGPEAVRERILLASQDRPHSETFTSIDEGRRTLNNIAEEFFRTNPTGSGKPEIYAAESLGDQKESGLFAIPADTQKNVVWGVSATMELGKTEAVLQAIKQEKTRMRLAGDGRAILFAVPYHRLSNDLLGRAAAMGLKVRVWRGQSSKDFDGELMCHNLEEAKENAGLMIPPEVTCGQCPHRSGCRYIAQYEKVFEDNDDPENSVIDLWIVAHHLLFSAKLPRPIWEQEVSHVVVDESIHPAAIDDIKVIALEGMLSFKLPDDPADANDLDTTRRRLCAVFRILPDGTPLHRCHLEDAGITFDEVSRALSLEWKRMVKLKDGEAFIKEAFRANASLMGMVNLWTAVKELLARFSVVHNDPASGWLEATTTMDSCRAVIVRGRKHINTDQPTLLINGTLVPELERLVFPDLQIVAEISVDIPHQYIVQVTDRTFYNDYLKGPKVQRALRAATAAISLHTGREGLLITNKVTGEALRPSLSCSIDVANYGAIAGRDEWRGRDLVLAGRNQIPAQEAENAIMSLTGWAVERVPDGKYLLSDQERAIRLDDGTMVRRTVQAARHPDPLVEAFRWHACEGQLVQSLARPRAMTYGTADAPVITLVVTDAPLPVPVNAEASGENIINPPEWASQLAEGGVVFETKDHAMKAYPSLYRQNNTRFRSEIWDRPNWPLQSLSGHKGVFSGKDTYRDLPPTVRIGGLAKAFYRLAGVDQKTAAAWIWPKVCADPKAWLAAKLGPLAEYSLGEQCDTPADRVLNKGVVLDPSTNKGQWRWWGALTGTSEEACRKDFARSPELGARWQADWDASDAPIWAVKLYGARGALRVRMPANTETEARALLGFDVFELTNLDLVRTPKDPNFNNGPDLAWMVPKSDDLSTDANTSNMAI